MNNNLQTKINQLNKFLGIVLYGRDSWNFDKNADLDIQVLLPNGQLSTLSNLINAAVEAKRQMDYESAIDIYSFTINAQLANLHYLTATPIIGLLKVLLAANFFNLAFRVCSTMLADMQNLMWSTITFDYYNYNVAKEMFDTLKLASQKATDECNLNYAYIIAATYSGNENSYIFQRTNVEILRDFLDIQNYVLSHISN